MPTSGGHLARGPDGTRGLQADRAQKGDHRLYFNNSGDGQHGGEQVPHPGAD
jgi:hypothetical protein